MLRRSVSLLLSAALASSALATPVLAQGPAGASAPAATPSSPAFDALKAQCSPAAIAAALDSSVSLTSVQPVTAGVPRCEVRGTVRTTGEGAPDGSAEFELNLPLAWNHKFLFLGGGGFDGNVPKAALDPLGRGYVTLGTDSGHKQDPRYSDGLDASWTVNPDGSRATAKIADYAFRSRHQVSEKLRPVVAAYYQGQIQHAYFMGCSGGGREALVEAQRYPDSYDGFISGDPISRPSTALVAARNFRVLMQAPISYASFPAIEQAVLDDCDAKDGVKDGLIQNPAVCSFDPRTLVARGVLTAEQGQALTRYLSVVRDNTGRTVGFGSSVSGIGDLGGAFPGLTGGLTGLSTYISDKLAPATSGTPWGPLPAGTVDWQLFNGAISAASLAKPNLSILDPSVSDAEGRIAAEVADATAAGLRSSLVDSSQMGRFFASGHKLLIYHGFDDAILEPYSTIATYQAMSETGGGLAKTRDTARLFMAPNMGHCFAGTGPNIFDALGAMEGWVERGATPDAIIAVKFKGNIPGPDKPIERSMPLCAFPEAARYNGTGDVNAAQSWTCQANDRRLTEVGPNGEAAGIGPTLSAFH